MDKRLLQVLQGQVCDRPPFWLMRQAGRYLPEYRAVREQAGSFLELCYRPELAEEVTLQPIRRFGMDAAILFADILLIPDGLGQPLEYREGEGPVLEPVRRREDVAGLQRDRVLEHVAPVFDTVARLSRSLPADVALIGFAGAPWTVACYMVEGGGSRDFATAKAWALGEPDGFAELVDLLVDVTAEYLLAQLRAGAEAVQLFDTWAGLLPETAFRRWCIEPVRQIRERLKAEFPDRPVIGFPRGAGAGYVAFAETASVDAVSLDWTVPARWAADVLQPRLCVQGNMDPRYLVIGGQVMDDEIRRILNAFRNGPYVFNLGHGIVPETPAENVAHLAEIIHAWPASAS